MGQSTLFEADLLQGEYYPRVVAYYFKEWNEFYMPFHTHEGLEIMYVISGICRIELAPVNQPREERVLHKGEFILLDANVEHRLIIDKGTTCRMLNVEFIFNDHFNLFPSMKELAEQDHLLKALLLNTFSFLLLRDPNEVYYVLKSLVLELDSRETDNEVMIHLLLSQLLMRIARLCKDKERSHSQHAEFYIRETMEFLHQNYDRDIKVKDIAASVNLHPGYLQRIFKSQTDRTLMDYLTNLRMEKAKMLLQQTDIPIVDISDYVGINSRQYFHALFKKHTNQTPADFRKSVDFNKVRIFDT